MNKLAEKRASVRVEVKHCQGILKQLKKDADRIEHQNNCRLKCEQKKNLEKHDKFSLNQKKDYQLNLDNFVEVLNEIYLDTQTLL